MKNIGFSAATLHIPTAGGLACGASRAFVWSVSIALMQLDKLSGSQFDAMDSSLQHSLTVTYPLQQGRPQ